MNKRRTRSASPAAPAAPKAQPDAAPENRGGTYFAMASELEAAIGNLPSVRAVRVVTDDQEIEEIHVLSEPGVQPKRLVRDIVTLLFVRFGVRIDHRRISIVQSEKQIAPAVKRPILQSVKQDGATRRMRAELRFGDQLILGESELGTEAGDLGAASSATLDAIARLLGKSGELSTLEARTLALGGEPIVIVLIQWQTGGLRAVLVGTSLIEEDQWVAAARATLDAVNRRLIRLPQGPAAPA
jgi:hypothetical protein